MRNVVQMIWIVLVSLPAVYGFTLEGYLNLVKKHSKDLKIAEREKYVAQANKKQALAGALPLVALTADYTRNFTDYYMYVDMGNLSALFGGGPGMPTKMKVKRENEYTANIALQQTLFSSNVMSAIKASHQYEKLTDYMYRAGEQAILTGAKILFYQTLLVKKLWDVNRETEKNAKENYENIKLKFDNGVASEFQLLQAQVRWKNAIPQTAESRRNYEMALNNLKNWAGVPVGDTLVIEGDFESLPPLPEKPSMEVILQQRPDYNALVWEQKLRQTNVTAVKNSFLPTLTANLVFAYSAQSDYYKLEQENSLWMGGIGLSLPISTGGYRLAEVQKASVELDKSRIKVDQTRDKIYNEITNIYLRLKEAHQRIESAEAVLQAAEKGFRIAEHSARSGLATQLELKDARVGYDQAMMYKYSAAFDYLQACFEWQMAIGRLKNGL
ncbi:TolC family protein [candidate division KSB1 bacterium]|nr:TolC family protein [candidate division KSB1 bacterium]